MRTERISVIEELKRTPNTPDLFILRPEPGDERAPIRSFRMVNSLAQLECIIEGRGLTLERAVAEETQYFLNDDGGASNRPYDTVFYEGETVAAVVRNFGDGKGSFRVMPIGDEWVWHVNDIDAIDELEPDEEALEAEAHEEDDEPTEGELVILKVIRGAGLSVKDACEVLGRWVKAENDDEMEGIRALTRFRAERIAAKPVAFSVTEGDYHVQHYPRRWTEDRVIAEALADRGEGETHDQAVWHGERLVAVIKARPDGTAEVVRA